MAFGAFPDGDIRLLAAGAPHKSDIGNIPVASDLLISHQLPTAAADPGMSTALRSVGLLDVLSSTSAGPSVARLVSTPVCAASLRNLVRNAG